MRASVVEIEIADQEAEHGVRGARVRLDFDGEQEWFTLTIKPRVLRGFDASLIMAGDALQDRFRADQGALHAICALVGRAARHDPVHLPQRVAA